MLRSELINALCKRQPHILREEVVLAVECILEQMMESLEKGERIEIRDFGAFSLHHRSPRKAHNPRTGEYFTAPAKAAVYFRPGKGMKDKINSSRGIIDLKKIRSVRNSKAALDNEPLKIANC